MTSRARNAGRIAEIVRHYRDHASNWSLKVLADQLRQATGAGSAQSLSAWMTGERPPSSRDHVKALRQIVGCRCPEFVDQVIDAAMPQAAPRVGTRRMPAAGSALAQLQSVSRAAVAECDLVTVGVDARPLTFSGGLYVTRKVEDLILKRLTMPSVHAVVGEAGHGKTALMWQLHRSLTDRGVTPILVPASALLAPPGHPAAATGTGAVVVTPEMIGQAAHEAARRDVRLALLVDTLDLLHTDGNFLRLVNDLLAVAFEQRIALLVTSRPLEVAGLKIDCETAAGATDSRTVHGIHLRGYEDGERASAIAAYARAFYPPHQSTEAARIITEASVRGLPIVEICRSPLALRLLFELYGTAGQMPRRDIDSIGLYEEFWLAGSKRTSRLATGGPAAST